MTPEKKVGFNNDGEVISYNRATRRRKPPTNSWFTKATHKFKKLRSKNVKSNQQRKRELARIRKARKESSTQIS